MQEIQRLWRDHVERNPIDGISLEIYLARRLGDYLISYELAGEKFNEILSDFSLLEIWNQWRSETQVNYYLNDMTMILGESGDINITLDRTVYGKYLRLPEPQSKAESDSQKDNSASAREVVEPGQAALNRFPKNSNIFVDHEVLARPAKTPDTSSNLHIKCLRRIPLGFNAFPPSDNYHAIERIAFRRYEHRDFTVYFQITRPPECSKKFEELLVNWQGSKFSIRIAVKNPNSSELGTILEYLGWVAHPSRPSGPSSLPRIIR